MKMARVKNSKAFRSIATISRMELLSLETTCTCEQVGNDSFRLYCTDAADCQYCDENETVCAEYSQNGALINQRGLFVSFSDTFNYISGRDDTIIIEDNGLGCAVTINGETCSKYEIVDCQQESSGPGLNYAIDCSKVLLCAASYL
jgi:hypothetical protein